MITFNWRVGPLGSSRVWAVLVTVFMFMSALPMVGVAQTEGPSTVPSDIGPTALELDVQNDVQGTESRYKEFPNSDSWEWLNPLPALSKLNDVAWQPGLNVAVIVGHNGLILERQGNYWSTIQSNTVWNLWHAEWRPSGDYALIVGNSGTVIKYMPGSAQTIRAGTSERLQGVAWKSDGSYALICGWNGLLMKYDGSKFTTIETGTDMRLYNVSYSNLGGWLISGQNGILLSYDETSGKVQSIPTGLDDMLYSLDWHGSIGLIVGGNGTILKYQNNAVSKVVNGVTPYDLLGVEWDEINDLALIVGSMGTAVTFSETGGLKDISPSTGETLTAVSFLNNGNDALVVGTGGIIYNYVNAAPWTLLSSTPFQGDFKDVAYSPDKSEALIVGSGGRALKYNQTGLSTLSTGVTTTLRGISWAPNGTYALVVGDDGVVLQYNKSAFSPLQPNVPNFDLMAVDWMSDGSYALIVGTYGKILKFNGTKFSTIIPEDQGQFFFFSVAFHPSNAYAYVVGASGMAYKCDEDANPKYLPAGMKCLRVATGVFSTLKDVEFRDDGFYGLMVGMSGIVMRFEGDQFTEVGTEMMGYTLTSMAWKTDSIYPVIVGSEGIFMKYSGYGVVQMPCPASTALNGIAWNGSSAIIVGDKGQILRYDSPPLNDPFASIWKPGEGTEFTIQDNIDFSGFSSLAPDDASVQFFWLSNVSGTLSTEPKFTTKLPVGHHRVTLYVNATGGRSDSDHVDINVKLNAQPPKPVISSPPEGRIYNTTDDIFFDASKSTDPNGDALSFHWASDVEGSIASGTGFTRHLSVVGIHLITLYAYDGIFNKSTSVNITLKLPNRAPDISIVTPKAADVIHTGDLIRFEATALDKDGDPMKYSWFSNKSGYLDNHKIFQNTLEEGKHRIEFHAEDTYNHNVTAIVNITVLPKAIENIPPMVVISWPDDDDELSGTVNVTGTATDEDGNIVVVEYQIGTDNWRAVTGNETWTFEWDTVAYPNGEYSFRVRAYDGKNHTVVERNITIANKWKDVHASILYPANNLELSGNVKVTGRATHDKTSNGRYINLVQVRIDGGNWEVAQGTDPWTWTFKTENYKNGNHIIEVRATDDDGANSTIEKVTIKVKNTPKSTFGLPLTVAQCGIIGALLGLVIVVIIYMVLRKPSKPASTRKGTVKGKPKARPFKDEEAEEALDREMAKDDDGTGTAKEEE